VPINFLPIKKAMTVASTKNGIDEMNKLNSLTDSKADPIDDLVIKENKKYSDKKVEAMMGKFEIPFGLYYKLEELGEFELLDFIIDDSGSMNNESDVRFRNGWFMTRWEEVCCFRLTLHNTRLDE
jgi:hypothetical protein